MPTGVYIRTEEHLTRIRQMVADRPVSKGWKWSDEAKLKSSIKSKGVRKNTGRTHFKKGFKPWNKGIKYEAITGEKNVNWKGVDVSYRNLHKWVVRHLGQPDICENCGASNLSKHKIHWANKSREYKRKVDDWIRLCAACHKAYDTGKLTLSEIGG